MEKLRIEVVFARAQAQDLVAVELPSGATVREAVRRSGLFARDRTLDPAGFRLGIGGKQVALTRVLADGERVEILRPLAMDPKEARRRRVRRNRGAP